MTLRVTRQMKAALSSCPGKLSPPTTAGQGITFVAERDVLVAVTAFSGGDQHVAA